MIWTNFAPFVLLGVCSKTSLLFVSCPGIVFDLKFVHITLLSCITFSCSSPGVSFFCLFPLANWSFWVVSMSFPVLLACILTLAINICILGLCSKVKLTNILNKMFKKHSGGILHFLGPLVIISFFLSLSLFFFYLPCHLSFPTFF